ncbi:hypothetical protein [Streptodolium elevatio]
MTTGRPPSGYSALLVEDDDVDAMLVEEVLLSLGGARSLHRECDGGGRAGVAA